jgi:Rod binding domain-containing protein
MVASVASLPSHPSPSQNQKIDKSAKDFESLLLTNWLQSAQQSFASVPGGDQDADADPGGDQLQSLAMQSLGTALTASGGIGLAHSIAQLLHRSDAPAPPEK